MKKHFTCANAALSTPPCNSHRVGTISLLILALMLGFSSQAMAGGSNIYLKGINGNWGKPSGFEFQTTSNPNVFTLTVELSEVQSFKVGGGDSWDSYNYGLQESNQKVKIGNNTLKYNTNNITGISEFTAGTYTFTFTVTEAKSTATLLIEKAAHDPCPNCKTITKQ